MFLTGEVVTVILSINTCVTKEHWEPSSKSMFASTWVLLLVTVATTVFSKQIGSLVKYNVVVVDVISTDALDVC